LDLQQIGQQASSEISNVAELAVDGEQYDWLAQYLDAVGKTWQATGITKSHVASLLPDQHGKLRNFGELRRDGRVSDRVKLIAGNVDLDIKAQLLDDTLLRVLTERGFQEGLYAIHESTGEELGEDEAVRHLVRHIADALPTDRPIGDKQRVVATETIALLDHLWSSQGEQAQKVAWEIPLLAAAGTARRAGHRRLMVPPVATWSEVARPFVDAYPAGRVLADDYANAPMCESLLDALAAWGIAHRGLLVKDQREELQDRSLRAIAVDPEEVTDARLRDAELMQIALLEPEVINYCKQSRERARALLGLVVCYVGSADKSWYSMVEMMVRTSRGEKPVQLTPSLWLANLRSKPWIPVEDEQNITHHVPNPELLRELIDASWLEA
jgi:hypothetical protein